MWTYYSPFNFILNELVIIMTIVTFKDGASVKLHEDGNFDIVELSKSDVNFNYFASVTGKEVELFNLVNRRLGGVLSP